MLADVYKRPARDLRISVTDRCNYRCVYCMPCDEYEWIERAEILSFEEIARLARIFVGLGVQKVRLTGGEPLVRKDLHSLVGMLSAIEGLDDICLTTNGSLLAEQLPALKSAGLSRVNVSLDTLDPLKFRAITKRGDLDAVLKGLFAAKDAGLHPIKINAVVERGANDDDILPLVEFAREHRFGVRFIEYMDVGNANHWVFDKMVPKREILDRISSRYPLQEVGRENGTSPSIDYQFADGVGDLGVIASVTEPFCSTCTRVRLTANGKLVTCLFADHGYDLKALLRNGGTDDEITDVIRSVWLVRRDRYSDERLQAMKSGGYHPEEHKKIEMISLGG
ncbi:MAG TPA: GTP 3',8-cyclase MoaA [Blastocatellia bacterium]|nr:GTP 3',8-cyclase MoaA [Blastocatellia bacterium]